MTVSMKLNLYGVDAIHLTEDYDLNSHRFSNSFCNSYIKDAKSIKQNANLLFNLKAMIMAQPSLLGSKEWAC